MKLVYLFIYLVFGCIIFVSIIKWIPYNEEKKDLIQYRVIDVEKRINSVYLLVELNNHYYLMQRSFNNAIFRHYPNCPYCRNKFVPFIFSIHDGLDIRLQNKYKSISKGE